MGIEVEDLERFGVDTLPTGASGGTHYFHLTLPTESPDLDAKAVRQRRIDAIREGLSKKSAKLFGLGLGIGRPGDPRPSKRSVSPFVQDWGTIDRPRALFVRPSEVVFIMGAE